MSRGGWRKRANDGDGWGGMGGYMAAKVSKLDEQFRLDAPREKQKEGTCSNIFSGVAIYVNGYTDPTADELRRLMMLHGGQFHVYYSRSKTTHIIATNLPNNKIQELRGEKVVRPDWITDSIKAGRLLSYIQYQLYAKQKGLSFPKARELAYIHRHHSTRELSHAHHHRTNRENSHAHLAGQDGDCRPNGSMRPWPDLLAVPKMNGVRAEGSESPDQSPVSAPWGSMEKPLTNGHAHPVNGALKPLDLALHSGRPRSGPPPRCDGTPSWAPLTGLPALLPPPPPRAPGTSGPGPLPAKPLARPAESNIISEFYSYSRLHHISTWRSEFSQYVSSLQQQRRAAGGAVFPGRERLKRHCAARGAGPVAPAGPQTQQPCIMHVDMDCFFVSVGIRHRPELKGKPVAVTSNRGPGHVAQRPGANPQMELQYYQRKWAQNRPDERDADLEATPSPDNPENHGNGVDQDVASLSMAEIASCSYEARQAGVRNGMFFGQAKQLCPALQSVPYDFQAYKEVAQAMYETLASYTHDIEALSCDEALLDASGVLAEMAVSPDELAGAIRADVRERTGCSASVGMGSNILLARMATRKAKPDGQYNLKSEEVDDFIRDQSVTSLPGVGRSMGCKLASLGVRTCGDLQQIPMSRLQKEFGPRTGQTLYRFCRGLDDRPVRSEKERKSVSAEMNYGIRFTQVEEAESFLGNLSLELQRRLQGAGLRGRRLTLKVMVRKPGAPTEPAKYGGHGICDNLARAVNLDHPTDCAKAISTAAVKLFHSMKLSVTDLRGVGVQMQQLVGGSGPTSESPHRPRSVIDMLLAQRTPGHPAAQADSPSIPSLDGRSNQNRMSPTRAPPTPKSTPTHATTPPPSASPAPEPVPGTSKGEPPPRYNGGLHTPSHARTRLNLSIEVPSPSQVDRSVLEALPAELREQVEQSWRQKEAPPPSPPPPLPPPAPPAPLEPVGTLVLHISDQAGQSGPTGIILELPDFSQVDPEVFAALPVELQEELRSAYRGNENTPSHGPTAARNPLLQLKQPTVGRTKRRYKRKNTSPAKKGASPLKARLHGNSPAKSSPAKLFPHVLKHEDGNTLKVENGPTVSPIKPDIQHQLSKLAPRPGPTLAGACELSDIRTLLKEWVTTMSGAGARRTEGQSAVLSALFSPDPMEEDILQVVKYCTELVEDRDLEKLDLVIKYMKRLMQQSVESVWSMAFDFILDNVQVVVQQTYGSTLKIT
ncbi:hypothetical protein AGOR_G00219410 [Albula goreensis]|uniref:DNA repair protein REV1 n=1 Tax=Albula goreensis TaxID=1534307 RepID=A0A8T3CNC8_9TELE|nr:hypothetical protein AGOR_G00219410 [Albula goreensis]